DARVRPRPGRRGGLRRPGPPARGAAAPHRPGDRRRGAVPDRHPLPVPGRAGDGPGVGPPGDRRAGGAPAGHGRLQGPHRAAASPPRRAAPARRLSARRMGRMGEPARVLLISGSTRGGSVNTAALATVAALAPAPVTAVAYDGLAALPAFN